MEFVARSQKLIILNLSTNVTLFAKQDAKRRDLQPLQP